jgi:hypothetical protein
MTAHLAGKPPGRTGAGSRPAAQRGGGSSRGALRLLLTRAGGEQLVGGTAAESFSSITRPSSALGSAVSSSYTISRLRCSAVS